MKEFLHGPDFIIAVWFVFMIYFWYQLLMGFRGFFMKPWKGWDMAGVLAVVSQFAHAPKNLKINFDSPKPNRKIFFFFVAGWYIAQSQDIFINTEHVRDEKQLVNTLLHEICHHNQFVGGRLAIGQFGRYYFRPIEREARAFADIWYPTAMAIYQDNKKKKK